MRKRGHTVPAAKEVSRDVCGKCIRGLLCAPCNTALGHIERKLHLAQAYLAAPRRSHCGD